MCNLYAFVLIMMRMIRPIMIACTYLDCLNGMCLEEVFNLYIMTDFLESYYKFAVAQPELD